jgi:hypothetical protein
MISSSISQATGEVSLVPWSLMEEFELGDRERAYNSRGEENQNKDESSPAKYVT